MPKPLEYRGPEPVVGLALAVLLWFGFIAYALRDDCAQSGWTWVCGATVASVAALFAVELGRISLALVRHVRKESAR